MSGKVEETVGILVRAMSITAAALLLSAIAPVEAAGASTATLTAVSSPTAGGEVSPSGASTVNTNEPIELRATAVSGYEFAFWTASPSQNCQFIDSYSAFSIKSDRSPTYASINADVTITAIFFPADATYKLTLKASPDEALESSSPTKGTTVDWSKDEYSFATAYPNDGYYFSSWTADPEANVVFGQKNAQHTGIVMKGDATITANFTTSAPVTRTITFAKDPEDVPYEISGKVDLADGDCDSCYVSSNPGDYYFSHWTADPADKVVFVWAGCSSTYFTCYGDARITAHFTKTAPVSAKVLITNNSFYKNSCTVSPSGWQTCQIGDSISLKAVPADSYVLKHYSSYGDVLMGDLYTDSTTATVNGNGFIRATFDYAATAKMDGLSGEGKLTASYKESVKRGDIVSSVTNTASAKFTLPSDFDYSLVDEYTSILVSSFL